METLSVIVIVASAFVYLWRNVTRRVKSGPLACGCGGCLGCPMAGQNQSCGK